MLRMPHLESNLAFTVYPLGLPRVPGFFPRVPCTVTATRGGCSAVGTSPVARAPVARARGSSPAARRSSPVDPVILIGNPGFRRSQGPPLPFSTQIQIRADLGLIQG